MLAALGSRCFPPPCVENPARSPLRLFAMGHRVSGRLTSSYEKNLRVGSPGHFFGTHLTARRVGGEKRRLSRGHLVDHAVIARVLGHQPVTKFAHSDCAL